MNETFKEWLDKQPLLSVNQLHNGQYYLTDEQALDFAKYYSNKQLLLRNVVNRRELLVAFYRSIEGGDYLYPDECDMHVDDFLESN